jgi:hypothetical protein
VGAGHDGALGALYAEALGEDEALAYNSLINSSCVK